MKRTRIICLLASVLALLCIASLAYAQSAELTVSAAASLTDALKELSPQAEKALGVKLLLNFGGSGALRKQIEEGAPVDVFFSAAAEDMDKLEKKGLIDAATRRNLLSNAIVLVGGDGQQPIAKTEDLRPLLASAKLLAIGNPDSVPAGRYAVQALTTYGLYSLVEGKRVLGGSVREVLQYVESGSAPLGIVFLTDALSVKPGSPVRRLFVFPKDALKTPVMYPAAVVRSSKNADKAARLIEFLQGSSAKDVFKKAGFVIE